MSLDKLSRKKKRAKLRHMTSANDHLAELCKKEFDQVTFNDAMFEFDKVLTELDSIQQELELVLDDTELDTQITEFINLRKNFKKTKIEATKFMSSQVSVVKEPSNTSITSFSATNVKLPKIVLPTFSVLKPDKILFGFVVFAGLPVIFLFYKAVLMYYS